MRIPHRWPRGLIGGEQCFAAEIKDMIRARRAPSSPRGGGRDSVLQLSPFVEENYPHCLGPASRRWNPSAPAPFESTLEQNFQQVSAELLIADARAEFVLSRRRPGTHPIGRAAFERRNLGRLSLAAVST